MTDTNSRLSMVVEVVPSIISETVGDDDGGNSNNYDASTVVVAPAVAEGRHPIQQQQQQQQLNSTSVSSIPKIMTQLLTIPSNRSCADCKSALVDTSQIYASFSPTFHPKTTTTTTTTTTSARKSNSHNDTLNDGGRSTNPFNDIPFLKKSSQSTTTTKKVHFDQRHQSFQKRHEAFKPIFEDGIPHSADKQQQQQQQQQPQQQQQQQQHIVVPVLQDWNVDPAISINTYCNHGVFVCALCAAAHQLLKRTTTIVRSAMDTHSWTFDEVQLLCSAGGNIRATTMLEAYYIPSPSLQGTSNKMGVQRPTSTSTIEERLTFVRAKYEALLFVLPSPVTSNGQRVSRTAWENIVQLHPEWDGLWGANLQQQPSGTSTFDFLQNQQQFGNSTNGNMVLHDSTGRLHMNGNSTGWGTSSSTVMSTQQSSSTMVLPNRLIDYFCVVTASDYLHASVHNQDLSSPLVSPEDIILTPTVTDCIPSPDFYNTNNNSNHDESKSSNENENNTFPEHVSTFVYPDGCTPSLTQLPPLFFTLVLTNASGERLYGGVLRLYDDNYDTVEKVTKILQCSDYPIHKYPSWLPNNKSKTSSPFIRSNSLATSPTNSTEKNRTTSSNNKSNLRSSKSEQWIVVDTTTGPSTTTTSVSDVMFLPKSLVILSHYPFFDIFRKFLLHIYRIALTEAPLPIERFVTNFVCEVPLPPPGKIQVKFSFTIDDCWTIERPPENQLPMANFSFRPLFTCLSIPNVLVVMGCLLQETRIILVSKHYAILCPVSEALLSILFPFHWQGMYLPILPYNMLEILDAPVPYLVGLHSRYLNEVRAERRPKGVVIVDLDRDEVHLGFDDQLHAEERRIPCLPDRHATKLRTKLLEVAASAYVLPNTQSVGYISTGVSIEIPQGNREPFAQSLEIPHNATLRRRDVLPQTDKAFRDNELLLPISGFLSEQGQLYQQSDHSDSLDKKPQKFPFTIQRLLKSPSDTTKSAFGHDEQNESNYGGLLDMVDPPGFNTSEIRQAFLRFFTSLFQSYRSCLIEKDSFRSEDFLAGLNLTDKSAEFVKEILGTQMFQSFTEERRENPNDPEVRFFDDSITAKLNRSKKVVLTGRKKETTFLNDTRSLVTETYTPPPPNNFGLPDDGRTYQYSTFPKLNYDLLGKVRAPKRWNNQNLRETLRTSARRSSIAARINEQAVVEKASRSLHLTNGSKRKPLDNALKALSSPFHVIPRQRVVQDTKLRGRQEISSVHRERSESVFSNVTLPSEFDYANDAELTSADEIVLNVRRKQAILISIITKFQAACRLHLKRKRAMEEPRKFRHSLQVDKNEKNRYAANFIQRWLASRVLRKAFARTRKIIVKMQARRRGIVTQTAYLLLLRSITRLQAVCRGFLARTILSSFTKNRMNLYQRRIFSLWNSAYTPLSYRVKVWSILNSTSFLRLKIAELELLRLMEELKIPIYEENICAVRVEHVGIYLCSVKGIANINDEHVLENSDPSKTSSLSSKNTNIKSKALDNLKSDRVAAERTQFYDRLSLLSEDGMIKLFSRLSIPLSEKKKKVSITERLWRDFDDADQWGNLTIEIFPELRYSTDINFLLPSKKALRRFPCHEALPRPLPVTLQAQSLLHDRVRLNLAEIADHLLRKMPQLLQTITLTHMKSSASDWRLSRLTAHLGKDPNAVESEARVSFIRRTLWSQINSNGLKAVTSRLNSSITSDTRAPTLGSISTENKCTIKNDYHIPSSLIVPKVETVERLDRGTQGALKLQGTREFSMRLTWKRR